jgi:hypothetical protein
MEAAAHLYDEIVQRLSTAILAREMGRDDLADSNLRAALEVARTLASPNAEAYLRASA